MRSGNAGDVHADTAATQRCQHSRVDPDHQDRPDDERGEAAATTTSTYSHTIAVAAVADGPTISGAASGNEDQPIGLPIAVTRIDADGSEQYEFAVVTVPAGVTLIYPSTPPNGISVLVSGDSHTFTPGATTTAVQFQSFLATGLQVQAPADSDVNFDVDVRWGRSRAFYRVVRSRFCGPRIPFNSV